VSSEDHDPHGRSASRGPILDFLRRRHPVPRLAAWREAFYCGTLVAAVFLPFDFLYGERAPATLATRAALVAILLGSRWWIGKPGRAGTGYVVTGGAVAAAVLTPALVLGSAGVSGPRFGFLLTVPFLLLALLPEVPAVATFAGAVAALAGGAALFRARQPVALVVEWTVLSVAVIALAAWGARSVHALAGRAAQAERERHAMLVQLADSERRRATSERLALLGRLAAGVGHEINNPLAAVKGNVACALEELARGAQAPGAREALEEALVACDRIAWISADLRALATEGAAPLAACDVGAAIREGLARASERLRHLTVLTSLEPGLPPVLTEPRLLGDAIGHLAAHAAHTAAEGRAAAGPATVHVAARRIDGGVEISVDDDGPPIPAHLIDQIFEPFVAQGAVRGSGLGLALPLTRELAERSGGRVAAAWRDGRNRFTVTLESAGD
jgi:signal transduction histidine kinase